MTVVVELVQHEVVSYLSCNFGFSSSLQITNKIFRCLNISLSRSVKIPRQKVTAKAMFTDINASEIRPFLLVPKFTTRDVIETPNPVRDSEVQ